MKEYKLWYGKPAEKWEEALVLGNGILGMMVFGGTAAERIQLNEETLWSGYPYDNDDPATAEHLGEMRGLIFENRLAEAQKLCEKYLICRGEGSKGNKTAYGSYQTAGDLYIKMKDSCGDESSYRRELNIRDGTAHIRFGDTEREHFVSVAQNVTVTRITGSGCSDVVVTLERENAEITCDGDTITAVGRLPLEYATVVKTVRSENETLILTSTATAYKNGSDPLERCIKSIDGALKAGYRAMYEENKRYFNEVLDRVRLDLDTDGAHDGQSTDERIKNPEGDLGLVELYFMFGRYLLLSSSRGVLPANLQGIWNKDYQAPWSADYHININIQMNYWFSDVCNMPEFAEPFYRYIEGLTGPGSVTARTAYNCGGWVAHTITNPWGFTSLGEHPSWGSFMCAGAWCCRHYYDHYLFNPDAEFLRRYYPVIRGCAEFFCGFLTRDPDTGCMVTCPSNSPENSYIDPGTGGAVSVTAGPTMDNVILYELFTITAECARILGTDSEFAARVLELRGKLPPMKIGKYGQIMEWQRDYDEKDPGHRHISSLYGLYPSAEITKSHTPRLFEAARRTIERRLANGGGHTGWSRAWIICFYARLFDGDAAYKNIEALLKKSTLPDMLDNHPPFQIDGNFGATAGIAELLLQSHEGFVNILPALPSSWGKGSFSGLCARGGYIADAEWDSGKVVRCSVRPHSSCAGRHFKVMVNGEIFDVDGSFDIK